MRLRKFPIEPWNRSQILGLLGVSLAFTILMALWKLDWRPMPIMGLGHALNDQVQYISGARNLLEHGNLETTSIYPSTLAQNTKTKILYVPGHYGVLALAFALFGVHFWSSILFSLLGFGCSVICVYLCGEKLFGKGSAFLAALMVLTFPFYLLFSLTAMAEMSVITSFLIAFTIFLYTPKNQRPYWGPLLAMIPICFRETSLVILFPMAAVIWRESSPQDRVRDTLKFFISSLVLAVLFIKGLFGGRPDLIKANVFGSFDEIYTDALFSLRFRPTLLQWITTCSHRFIENLKLLITDGSLSGESMAMKLLFVLAPLVFIRGVKRRHVFEIGVGIMSLVLLGAVLAIYAVSGFRGLRVSLILVPLIALILGDWISSLRVEKGWLVVFGIVFVLVSVKRSFLDLVKSFPAEREREIRIVSFIDEIKPDKEKIVIAPFWFAMPWFSGNYPVRWSLLPRNHSTFRLLQRQGPIGTILIHESELSVLSLNDFKVLGYEVNQNPSFEGLRFYLLKPKNLASAGSTSSR